MRSHIRFLPFLDTFFRSHILTWFNQDINPSDDYLALIRAPFSFFVIKFHLVDKGDFFCLGQFYCFLTITIVTIKRGDFAAFKAKINLLFLMVLNRQRFPDQAKVSRSGNGFPIKTVVSTDLGMSWIISNQQKIQ